MCEDLYNSFIPVSKKAENNTISIHKRVGEETDVCIQWTSTQLQDRLLTGNRMHLKRRVLPDTNEHMLFGATYEVLEHDKLLRNLHRGFL